MNIKKLEKEVHEELKDLGIKPLFQTMEEFDKFFYDPESVLKLKF